MSHEQILLTCLFLICGCVLQSAVGFGAAILAVPLLVWIDVDLLSAVVIVNLSAFIQCVWACVRYREHIPWRSAMPMHASRLLATPVGVVLLAWLVQVGQDRVKQIIGCVLLVVVVTMWALKVPPRRHVRAGWTVLCGALSGVLNGAIGMGGSPAVLWVMAHDWTSQRARSCLWSLFAVVFPFHLILLWWKFGDAIPEALRLGLFIAPAGVIGTCIGMRLGPLLSSHRLRLTVYAILCVLAISSIVGPMI